VFDARKFVSEFEMKEGGQQRLSLPRDEEGAKIKRNGVVRA